MALTPGLSGNIRQPALGAANDDLDPANIIVKMADEDADSPDVDKNGNILKINTATGGCHGVAGRSPAWFDTHQAQSAMEPKSR